MQFTIELDREVDGRWIAEVPELNVVLYGSSKEDAIKRAESTAREIVLDRVAHGEMFTTEELGPAILAKVSKKTGLQPRNL